MQTVAVDPARLEHGQWIGNRRVGKGDINQAYSADLIGEKVSRVRKPFLWQGQLMTVTGMGFWQGHAEAEAYRLVELRLFDGEPLTYPGMDWETARDHPLGAYHGFTVKFGRDTYVLTGPKIRFVGDTKLKECKVEQLSLL